MLCRNVYWSIGDFWGHLYFEISFLVGVWRVVVFIWLPVKRKGVQPVVTSEWWFVRIADLTGSFCILEFWLSPTATSVKSLAADGLTLQNLITQYFLEVAVKTHKMCVLWRAPDTACSRVCWGHTALGSTCKCFVYCSYPVKLKFIQLLVTSVLYWVAVFSKNIKLLELKSWSTVDYHIEFYSAWFLCL